MAIDASGFEPSRRYRSAAMHYLAGRPAYADLLVRRVAALTGLRRQDAVLDLGCGPGVLARAFAPLAGTVVGMDPEPEMLRVAQGFCADAGNVRLVAGSSEDLPASLGRFRLVVMGRSFHWMDRAPTLRRLDGMIEQGGAVVLFHTHHAAVPANAWVEQYRALRRRYGDDRPGPNSASRTGWIHHEAFLLDSPFRHMEAHAVFAPGQVDTAGLIARAFSMGGTAPESLGGRAADLERDIAALVRDIAPDGHLAEVIESTALIGRRPGEEAPA